MVQKRNNIELEAILVLLRGESHLRNIARAIEAPHSTVLRKLNNLAKENVLDYRKEGKNRVFTIKRNLQAKNYVLNAERYKLIKVLQRYPELNVIAEDVLNKIDEKIIILFGSYAKFSAKKSSDIDIYIDTNNRKIKEEVESINSRIRVKIGKFDMSSMLIREIVKNHVILKGAEDFYEKTKFFE